jgi:hypothetical protein
MTLTYERVAEELERRIEALVQQHPHVLKIHDPFDLFRIPEFTCTDLDPSMAQAIAALRRVQLKHQP